MSGFISVSSRDKTLGTNSNYELKLTNPIEDVKRIKVSRVVIPQSWYTTETHNSYIYFQTSGPTNWIAQMNLGVRNPADFATEIARAMNAVYTPDNNFTCTLDTVEYKYTIQHSVTNFSLTFGTNSTNSASSTIGYNDVDTSSALSHKADNVYNLGYNETIFIISTQVGVGKCHINNQKQKVVFPMTTNGNFGDLLEYDGDDGDWIFDYSPARTFDYLDFKLVYEDLITEVPLNGLHWRITLQFIK